MTYNYVSGKHSVSHRPVYEAECENAPTDPQEGFFVHLQGGEGQCGLTVKYSRTVHSCYYLLAVQMQCD
jgi:hypothetical protein